MAVASVHISDEKLAAIDDIAARISKETGWSVSRSDVLKQAIEEFLRNQD